MDLIHFIPQPYGKTIGAAAAHAIMMHMAQDLFTGAGVVLAYPFPDKHFHILRLNRENDIACALITIGLFAALICFPVKVSPAFDFLIWCFSI